jgi:hypothetical protein
MKINKLFTMLFLMICITGFCMSNVSASTYEVSHTGVWWLDFTVDAYRADGGLIDTVASGNRVSKGYSIKANFPPGTAYAQVYVKCVNSGSSGKTTALIPINEDGNLRFRTGNILTARWAKIECSSPNYVVEYKKNF